MSVFFCLSAGILAIPTFLFLLRWGVGMNGTWEAGEGAQLPLFDGVEPVVPARETLSFADALSRVKSGGAVYRAAWGEKNGLICLASRCRDETGKVEIDPFLAYVAGFRAMVWMPAVGDLLADDWVPVEP